jgi:hypothetical protein
VVENLNETQVNVMKRNGAFIIDVPRLTVTAGKPLIVRINPS